MERAGVGHVHKELRFLGQSANKGKPSAGTGCLSKSNSSLCNSIGVISYYLFIYLEGGEEKERNNMCERNIRLLLPHHPTGGTWPATQACTLMGNRTSDFTDHRPGLNPLSHTSQSGTIC